MINKFNESKAFTYENGFYLTSMPYRMGNIVAHYELYKRIMGMHGSILELGVFKGASLIQWATFRELLENELSRKIIGFDVFGQFPMANSFEGDREFVEKWNGEFESEFVSKEEIEQSLDYKKIGNVELVKGDILKTLPEYLADHKELRLSLLHIDTCVYEPCKLGLELLYDLVVPGGIIVLDDYGVVEGETQAVDEFFSDKNILLRKLSLSHHKPTFIIKGR